MRFPRLLLRVLLPLIDEMVTVKQMQKDDANKKALEQVEKATQSEPVFGEELLESEELQQQLREAKERESARPKPDGK